MKITITLTATEAHDLMRRARAACGYWGRFSMTTGPRARLCCHEIDNPGSAHFAGAMLLGRGVALAMQQNRHCTHVGAAPESWDLPTVDRVIQFALFGEIRYA